MLALLILALLSPVARSVFCSSDCKYDSCIGTQSNECTACDIPFDKVFARCEFDTTQQTYEFLANSSDITSTVSATKSCGSYSYYGPLYQSSSVTLRYSNALTSSPHYCVRLVATIFLIDQWNITTDLIWA